MGGNETDGYPMRTDGSWDGDVAPAAVAVRIGIRIHRQAGAGVQDGANRTRLGVERNGTGTPNLRRAGSSCRPAEPTHSEFLKHQPVFLSPILERGKLLMI